jgi:hypothetical protein
MADNFWDQLLQIVGGKPKEYGVDTVPGVGSGVQSSAADLLQQYIDSGDWMQQKRQIRGSPIARRTPSMNNWRGLVQQYAASPAPYIMGQAAGTLGSFMNPQLQFDPNNRLGGMFEGRELTNLFDEPYNPNQEFQGMG